MKRTIVILVLLSLGLICAAPVPKNKTAPQLTVIMATTDDGRRVVLMSDGSWSFIAGAPAPVTAPSCRDQEFDELVRYFSGWPIDQVEKGSGLISTKFMNADLPAAGGLVQAWVESGVNYQVSLSIVVNPDCTLDVKSAFRTCGEGGCHPIEWKQIRTAVFEPLIPGMTSSSTRNFYIWYRNHMLALADIQKQHAPSAPGLAVPPPPPAPPPPSSSPAAPPSGPEP